MSKNCCSKSPVIDPRCMSVKDLLEKQYQLNDHLQIGKAWISMLSVNHFKTAIAAELGELIDQPSSPQYKWWKAKDASAYSEWMTKLELVDAAHFFLSVSILEIMKTLKAASSLNPNKSSCLTLDNMFLEFDDAYIGVDHGNVETGVGLITGGHVLNYDMYVRLHSELMCKPWDYYEWVDTLNLLPTCMGMTCAEFSALYTAKATLNEVRWQHPNWQKIDIAGVEDNERLFGVVSAFLGNSTMTLPMLRQAVLDEFYTQI